MATPRGKNFGSDELSQLCYSYLEISQDPCVGSGQKKDSFWERVAEHYEKNKARHHESRSAKSLESKWGDVRKATTRFIGFYKAVEDLEISGVNTEDIQKKARELYKQRHPKNKDFTNEECYHILKDCPRWMVPEDQMRKAKSSKKDTQSVRRTTSNGTEILEKDSRLPSDDSDIQSETEGLQKDNGSTINSTSKRPLGSKQAKENVKKARHLEDAMRVSAQAQKLMAETGLQRLRVLESQTFMNMLTMPTQHLDTETRDFLYVWKQKEMAKMKERFSPSASVSPRPPTVPTAPTPPTASRTSLPTPEDAEQDEDSPYDPTPTFGVDGAHTNPYSEWDIQ